MSPRRPGERIWTSSWSDAASAPASSPSPPGLPGSACTTGWRNRFRIGGVFLAGDAAHVHSPAAGQGMNTGIADAFDLSTRLAAVLRGQAGAPTLDEYERNRRAAALEVLEFTDRMTRIAMLTNPVARRIRNLAAPVILGLGPVRRRIPMWITGLQRNPLRRGLMAPPGLETPLDEPA
jgi:flavin-dependent dehydrogenase